MPALSCPCRWPWPRVAAVLVVWSLWLPATAQNVYRCGPDGRVFSQKPCAGDSHHDVLDVRDARSEAQRSDAANVARREAELADRLMNERRAREAQSRHILPAGLHTAPRAGASTRATKQAGKSKPGKRPSTKRKAPKPQR